MRASNFRLQTLAIAASTLAVMQPASAQDAAAETGPDSLERVVVTGSRITREGAPGMATRAALPGALMLAICALQPSCCAHALRPREAPSGKPPILFFWWGLATSGAG